MPSPPSLTNPLGQGGTLASANAGVPTNSEIVAELDQMKFQLDTLSLILGVPPYIADLEAEALPHPENQTRGQVTDGLGFARRGVDPFIHAPLNSPEAQQDHASHFHDRENTQQRPDAWQ